MNYQKMAKMVGESGCYFLALLRARECEANFPPFYFLAVKEGWMQEDCLMLKPEELLSWVRGMGKEYEPLPAPPGKAPGWAPPDYETPAGAVEILRFELVKQELGKAVSFAHFVLGDGQGKVAWDPWEGSNTVRYGKLQSKRIFIPK